MSPLTIIDPTPGSFEASIVEKAQAWLFDQIVHNVSLTDVITGAAKNGWEMAPADIDAFIDAIPEEVFKAARATITQNTEVVVNADTIAAITIWPNWQTALIIGLAFTGAALMIYACVLLYRVENLSVTPTAATPPAVTPPPAAPISNAFPTESTVLNNVHTELFTESIIRTWTPWIVGVTCLFIAAVSYYKFYRNK